VRAGSTVALADVGGKTYAYVADEDDMAVHVFDVDAKKDVGVTPLNGRPAQLMFLADGRLVATIRDKAQVQVLEPSTDVTKPAAARCSIPTDAEPYGVASSPDDATVYVTTGWGRSFTALDAKSPTMQPTWHVAMPREPRAVIVSDDGARAFVSQAVGGQMSVIDLKVHQVLPTATHLTTDSIEAARKKGLLGDNNFSFRFSTFGGNGKSQSCQGFALAKTEAPGGRVLLPQALVDPGDPTANPSGYGAGEDQVEVGDVAVVDESSGDVLFSSLQPPQSRFFRFMSSDTAHDHQECLLPRAAAFDAKRKSLLVGCFGIDDVIEFDALSASPSRAIKRRWDVAAGPGGIAVDPSKDRAVVWAQFERVLNVINLGGPELVDDKGPNRPAPPDRVAASPLTHSLPTSIALGRVLFHMVGDDRISHDGRACASCHPDGRDDALTWSTPNGPRRSIMLAGRVADTAPFSWSGSESTLKEHMGITFSRLKGNGGLRSMELDALADFVQTLAPPPAQSGTEVLTDAQKQKIAHGSEIFHSQAAGCSGCHTGDAATDNQHHDVQSKTQADRSGNFNTPSLRFVSGGGPYFHDGRYKTLHELLTDSDRKMGHTAQLSGDDLEALEAYLRTL
jgi:DNA-binding beta-propeller fold protein YncE/mono/diheme cytochrome c family protein